MIPPRKIFRAYDIRGIAHIPANEAPDLTPEGMHLIGQAAGTYWLRHHGGNICVAEDCRLSNPELSDAFVRGVLSTGCDVTRLGMIPSPLMYYTVCRFNFDGGAAITASHNPKEYNGVKLVGPGAHSICGDKLQDIYQLILDKDFEEGQGAEETLDPFPAYLEEILEKVELKRPLKIVVDSGNGATGPFVQPFFEALGCEVISLYTEPDGNFPNHPANPEEEENMQDLAAAVQDHGADLGIGFDGDGDRVGIVDEHGKHYSADLLLLLLARDLLERKPGAKIVFDAKVSQVLINDIKANGGEPVMCKTGHSFIEQKMHELHAPLGGEISGHMFFAEDYYGFDDAMLGAAKLLEILSNSDKNFSELLSDLPKTAITPELKTPTPDSEKFRIVECIKNSMTEQYECLTIDGVRVNFDQHSWGAVRASNTTPNLTIRFEAPTPERLRDIMDTMLEELRKYPEVDLWWENQDLI